MIRYVTDRADLEARINAIDPNWLVSAAAKTAKFKTAGKYDEKTGTWSAIKTAYMQIQHDKCAYCERRLAGQGFGKVEHDVEHFRPKSSVKAWPTPGIQQKRKINYAFKTGDESALGYYLLAYDVLNYATACKTCNTALKSNFFPIAGKRTLKTGDFKKLKTEKPFLLYPLSDLDNDPTTLISFNGILPVAAKKTGHAARRALVTIDFFELDSREELRRDRADLLIALWGAHRQAVAGATQQDRDDGADALARAQRISSPHCACAVAFIALCKDDPTTARALFDAAKAYLDSGS